MGSKPPKKRATTRPPPAEETEANANAKKSASLTGSTLTKLPRRQTMEVQMAWLELDKDKDDKRGSPPPSSRRGPPKLPGLPDIPPMPVASSLAPPRPRANTIEVEMQWVELVDDPVAEDAKSSAPPAAAKTKTSVPPAKSKTTPPKTKTTGTPPPDAKASVPPAKPTPTSFADATRPRPRGRPIIRREDD